MRRAPGGAQGHWKTTTFIAGLKQSGIVAPLVLHHWITGPAFRACLEQFLASALELGDDVVLDELAAHKVDGVRQLNALTNQRLADAVENQQRLLLLALDGDEAHGRPLHRLADRLGVVGAGLELIGPPDLSAEGERDGFYHAQLIRELAVRHITSWTGVELKGGPAPTTPENVAAAMELYPVR